MAHIPRLLLAALALAWAAAWPGPPPAGATPQFSAQTGLSCSACHEDPQGGAALTDTGHRFRAAGYVMPPEGSPEAWRAWTLLVAGFLHVVTGVVWFGTIFYVHLFIGPRNLTRGLPKGERILGLSCVVLVGATGVVLAWLRLPDWASLVRTTFGLVLLAKAGLYLLMVGIAVFANTWLNRKLKEQGSAAAADPLARADGQEGRPARFAYDGRLYDASGSKMWENGTHMGRHQAGADLTEAMQASPHGPEVLERVEDLGPAPLESPLAEMDGREGRPAHIAYQGRLYDVSGSDMWKEGSHMGRHQAGADLTGALDDAPHGPEVLERMQALGPAPEAREEGAELPAARILMVLAYGALVLMLGILLCVAWWNWGPPLVPAAEAYDLSAAGQCLDCHQGRTPALAADWQASRHASAGVGCVHCHQETAPGAGAPPRAHAGVRPAGPGEARALALAVSAVVSPRRCAACHLVPARQFARSKHAGALAIIRRASPWLRLAQAGETEVGAGCARCHGADLRAAGARPTPGVGRVNPDGSRGSCAACHGRHRFSLAAARRPGACGRCHVGPDHPQQRIYAESKHGAIHASAGGSWNWDEPGLAWTAGVDYRTPTCAACHISPAGGAAGSHDVGARLAWELQAPGALRPEQFAAWPASTGHAEARRRMAAVCRQCHGRSWVEGHFRGLDRTVELWQREYWEPARQRWRELEARGLAGREAAFRQPLWWRYYELWRRAGRQARFGAAMMAPDFTWWHGFYEAKKAWQGFMRESGRLLERGEPAYAAPAVPAG